MERDTSLFLGLISIIFVLFGCAKPVDLKSSREELIVVDAKLSNKIGGTKVRIYSKAEGESPNKSLKGCNIQIVDSENNTTFFYEISPGVYELEDTEFVGEFYQNYKLIIRDSLGNLIESSAETLYPPVEFEFKSEVVLKPVEVADGILINQRFYDIISKFELDKESNYYSRYTFKYSYLDFFTGLQEFVNLQNYSLFGCGNNCEKFNDSELNTFSLEDRDWQFFNKTAECLNIFNNPDGPTPSCEDVPMCCMKFNAYEVSFTITQERMPQNLFLFWEQASDLRSNDGLIFNTYPFSLKGNVSCETCDYEVVGYFGVVGINRYSKPLVL
ncbi:MAG: DUF4249 family protein [Ekhidna sp.]|uniref:DUF4249 family protein n=1 Tax=Ekhidna sp. TaxID=2608089 RepID=UPI0032EC4859